jgi:hypothetical protein
MQNKSDNHFEAIGQRQLCLLYSINFSSLKRPVCRPSISKQIFGAKIFASVVTKTDAPKKHEIFSSRNGMNQIRLKPFRHEIISRKISSSVFMTKCRLSGYPEMHG